MCVCVCVCGCVGVCVWVSVWVWGGGHYVLQQTQVMNILVWSCEDSQHLSPSEEGEREREEKNT